MFRSFSLGSICLAIAGSILCQRSAADIAPEVKPFVDRFEARYRAARTLRATFLERYTENGRVARIEAGVAYFRRPGKMRWDYESPEKNVFLVDGKTAWFYVPTDHTATRVPAKSSSDWRTPLALLAGQVKVSRVCDHVQAASDEKPEGPDQIMLRCDLRGDGFHPPEARSANSPALAGENAEIAYFEIAKKTGELLKIVVRDPGGVAVEFHFDNWQTDLNVDDSLFQFHPPPGVAIVNGELPAQKSGATP
jgi:outer membrane lipoprotein carrier protein